MRVWTLQDSPFFTETVPAATLATHVGPIYEMAYSPSTGILVTQHSVPGTRVWQLNPAQVAASARQTLKAPISLALWQEYVPEYPYQPVCG